MVTQWNTWFGAALYPRGHLQCYQALIENEITQVGATVQLRNILDIQNGERALDLQAV